MTARSFSAALQSAGWGSGGRGALPVMPQLGGMGSSEVGLFCTTLQLSSGEKWWCQLDPNACDPNSVILFPHEKILPTLSLFYKSSMSWRY